MTESFPFEMSKMSVFPRRERERTRYEWINDDNTVIPGDDADKKCTADTLHGVINA